MATVKVHPYQPIEFTRIDPDVWPGFAYHLRVQVNERLTAERRERLAALVGYAWAQHVRGESLGAFQPHGHSAVVFWGADTTKSVRDDLGDAWSDFLEHLPELIKHGSPVRKTDRMGPGTKGTRKIEGLGEHVEVTVWTETSAIEKG